MHRKGGGEIGTRNKNKRVNEPTPTPKSHNVLIGSRASSPTTKHIKTKIKQNVHIHKLTHSSQTQKCTKGDHSPQLAQQIPMYYLKMINTKVYS